MLSQQVHAAQADAVPAPEAAVLPDQSDHSHCHHHADRYRRIFYVKIFLKIIKYYFLKLENILHFKCKFLKLLPNFYYLKI